MFEMIIVNSSLNHMWVIIGASWRGLSNEYSHVFCLQKQPKLFAKCPNVKKCLGTLNICTIAA